MIPTASRALRASYPRLASNAPHPKNPNYFKEKFFAIEVLPIWAVAGGALAGAIWYLSRLARSPDVVWDKYNNPRPWEHIKPNQQVKLFSINQKYDGEPFKRDRL